MRILVLGGEGMLGHKMFQVLSAHFEQTRCSIFGHLSDPFYRAISLYNQQQTMERVDAMDLSALRYALEAERPDVIINCVGVVKQRQEARMAIPSITINSLLPHLLAEWAGSWGGRLIHFSTDCVFSGKKGNYREDDPSDAEDLYGKSKYLGEAAGANALTLRTSIIGRELDHFNALLEWFLDQNGKKVKGYRRVIYAGVTTNHLADLVAKIIGDFPLLTGLYQVTAPPIDKYELLIRLRDAFNLDIEIIADASEVSDRSMNGARFLRATGYREPKWDELIAGLTQDKTPYDQWQRKRKHV